MKILFDFRKSLQAIAATALILTGLSASGEAEVAILRTIEFEAPFETTEKNGFHLVLGNDGRESFLAVPGALYRFQGSLTESTLFDTISPDAAVVGKVFLSQGRLLYLHGQLAEPDETGTEFLYLYSDDGGSNWSSIGEQFYFEEETQAGQVVEYHLPITWMQRRNGLLYCNAGGGANVLISADNGETWQLFNGLEAITVGSMGSRLITDEYLFTGSALLNDARIQRWPISEDGSTVTGEGEVVIDLEAADVMSFAEDSRTRSLFAGAQGGILRSDDRGETFEHVFWPGDFALDELLPWGSSMYPSFEHIWICPDYSGRILAGGFDHVERDVLLLYSDGDGTTESWINLSQELKPYGDFLAFIEQGVDGRILVGIAERDDDGPEETGTLTIAELKLPDPIRDRYPEVDQFGKGWWQMAAFGKFNAQWYPWQWHADLRGWMWNAEVSTAGGHLVWDSEIGWLWLMDNLYPLVWHYESSSLVRLDTERPGRVFQRYVDGVWVDLEGN